MYSILLLAISSFLICLTLTPLVRTWFTNQGMLDRPDSKRKVHTSPLPRVGGVAIAISYLGASAILLLSPLNGKNTVHLRFVWDLMPASAVIFATGLIDDLFGLRPWQKLAGQIAGAGLAYWAGVRVLGIVGFPTLGWWGLPLTVLWLVACANAFNLIDGVDGLAAGVGLFATLTIFLAALLQNNTPLALATVPLAGALLAFLRYNFNPASIFLGDCGSLSIGFLLGCYGVIWSQKSATLLGMTAPLMALSIPLLDTGLSIARRFLRRQPIWTADRNHIHHRLLDRGFSPRAVALLIYAVCGVAASFSLLQSTLHSRYSGLIILIFCAATWVGVQQLGYGEFHTARKLVLQGTFRHILQAHLYVIGFEKKLKAALTADECWDTVRTAARDYGFTQVRMHLGGTVYEERIEELTPEFCCVTRIPLSDCGYVNFTHQSESSVRHLVAISSLVSVLQRTLSPRAAEFQPEMAAVSEKRGPQRANAHVEDPQNVRVS